MLILLPPSEGKTDGARLNPQWLRELSFGDQLTDRRIQLIDQVGLPLSTEPVSPAIDIFQGVLYKSMDYRSFCTNTEKSELSSPNFLWSLWRHPPT